MTTPPAISKALKFQMEPGMAFEEWRKMLETATIIEGHAAPFLIGDALLFGEAEYGEMAAEAIKGIQNYYSPSSLQNFRWVAKAFPASSNTRNINVPHRVYEILAPIADEKERFRLAQLAADNSWTGSMAHKHRQALLEDKTGETDGADEDDASETETGDHEHIEAVESGQFEALPDEIKVEVVATNAEWKQARQTVLRVLRQALATGLHVSTAETENLAKVLQLEFRRTS